MENPSDAIESNISSSYRQILIGLNQQLHNFPKMQAVETLRLLMQEQLNDQLRNPHYLESRLSEERATIQEAQSSETNPSNPNDLIEQRKKMEGQMAGLDQQLSTIESSLKQLSQQHENEKQALANQQTPIILDSLQQALSTASDPSIKDKTQASIDQISNHSPLTLSELVKAAASSGALSSSTINQLEQASDQLAKKQWDELSPLWKNFEEINKTKQDLIKAAAYPVEYRAIPATRPEGELAPGLAAENNRPQLN